MEEVMTYDLWDSFEYTYGNETIQKRKLRR